MAYFTNTIDDAPAGSIGELVQVLFGNEPNIKNQIQIISPEADGELIFQILLNISMYGIDFLLKKKGFCGTTFQDMKTSNDPIVLLLKEYISMLGYGLTINEFEISDTESGMSVLQNHSELSNYYCIIKRNDFPASEEYANSADSYLGGNPFIFSLNPNSQYINNRSISLDLFYSAFCNRTGSKIFKVSFKYAPIVAKQLNISVPMRHVDV